MHQSCTEHRRIKKYGQPYFFACIKVRPVLPLTNRTTDGADAMQIQPTTKTFRDYAGRSVTELDAVATARDTVFRVLAGAKDSTLLDATHRDIAEMADDLRTVAKVFAEFLAAQMADIAYVAPLGDIEAAVAADFQSAIDGLLEDLPTVEGGALMAHETAALAPVVHCVRRAVGNVDRGLNTFAMDDLRVALKYANAAGDKNARASVLRMMNWVRAAQISNIDNSGQAPC